MQIAHVPVTNRLGLHGRACAKIVQTASRFSCEISIVSNGRRANARNILAVMLLAASVGTVVRLEAKGPEEAVALREMTALFVDAFGERA